jgi:hypothetical protein
MSSVLRRCVTALPRTCSSGAWISASSRSCSDTRACDPPSRLGYHPHVHLLITGGGTTVDSQHWEPARGQFLVPVFVLSRKIAALFRAALEAKAPAIFAEIAAAVWRRE